MWYGSTLKIGAKSSLPKIIINYVLQLAENVRRSNEQKNKNGEITGMAPLGYENYVDEREKKFVRPKEPDATIIKKMFEIYSLGNTSVAELVHYANIMGLKSRKATPISINSISISVLS